MPGSDRHIVSKAGGKVLLNVKAAQPSIVLRGQAERPSRDPQAHAVVCVIRATLVYMPKRTRNPQKLDTVQNARRVMIEATESVELTLVQQVMREMGAKGGKIGGKRRLETMTDEQRRRSARKSAKARWAKVKKTT